MHLLAHGLAGSTYTRSTIFVSSHARILRLRDHFNVLLAKVESSRASPCGLWMEAISTADISVSFEGRRRLCSQSEDTNERQSTHSNSHLGHLALASSPCLCQASARTVNLRPEAASMSGFCREKSWRLLPPHEWMELYSQLAPSSPSAAL
jgi:hypothetical protein